MKARTNDRIVCEEGHVMGRFRKDVEDEAAITSEDFEIDADIGDFKYTCKKCGKEIAVLYENRWRVHIGRGWIP